IGTRKNKTRTPVNQRCQVQHDIDFMVKDSKRFADSGGWGWAAFEYDAPSDILRPATVADHPPQSEMRVLVPHGGEDKRLRFHGIRAQVRILAGYMPRPRLKKEELPVLEIPMSAQVPSLI